MFKILLFALATGVAPLASANVVGPGTQNFNSTTNGLDFVTVQSSETLEPGIVHFGLFFNYSKNSLPYFDTPANRGQFSSALIGMDLNLGFGLMRNWDIGVSFPSVIYQDIEANGTSYGDFGKLGLTEVRPTTKYRLIGDNSRGVALVGSVNFNTTGNDPYKGADAGPGFNFEVAADTTLGLWAVALNLGRRWAQAGTRLPGSPIEPLRDQWIASTAASYLVRKLDTKFILELFGARPVDANGGNQERLATSLEGIIGAKHDFTSQLSGHAGLGTSLARGIASPDWRVYVGLNWDIGPVYRNDRPLIWERESSGSGQSYVSNRILFEFDSDRMVGEFEEVLQAFADHLKQVGKYRKIVIEGHTDSVGKDEYNQRLSERRASAVRHHLVQKYGIKSDTIDSVGYGASRPIADNGNFQGRQENRRVEFKIFF